MMTPDPALGRYGLPLEVRYCKCCTISNQRPSSAVEFRATANTPKSTINFGEDGVCDACRFALIKKDIDWAERDRELRETCDRYRRDDGRYDVLVPGSGGKDSIIASHLLKYKYGMHPLLVTWPPHLYTESGRFNFHAWLQSGFPNYTYWPNQKVHRTLTRLAFLNLVHPFQPFILGQRNVAPKLSVRFDIPFIMYGENQAEYGNRITENTRPTMDRSFFTAENELEKILLAGYPALDIMKEYNFSYADLEAYIPCNPESLHKTGTEVHYMGYYVNWHPQEVYYYSVENTEFMPNDERTEGSYSKYSSFDDKIDWLHYYTTFAKFGIGRATYDTCQEIRNGDISRDEGVRLIRRFDGEFPRRFLAENLHYLGIDEETFVNTVDGARPEHLWQKNGAGWKLRHPIWESTPNFPAEWEG